MVLRPYFRALEIGAVAGSRSFTAPAATLRTGESRFGALSLALAAAELIGDKLPFTPPRVSPPALAFRLLTGGWCGGTLAARNGGSRLAGSVVGGLAAVGSAWLLYEIRRELTQKRGWPDLPVALAEDALAVWAARAACAKAT